MPDIQIGQFTVSEGSVAKKRLAMLLWGMAGIGKTTLASTAPGNKLIINFDSGGPDSVTGLRTKLEREYPDLDTALKNKIYVLDVASQDPKYVGKFDQEDPFGLNQLLTNTELDISTVIVDSLTTLSEDVIAYATKYAGLNKSSLVNPGKQAYGVRVRYIKRFIVNLLQVTAKHNKHIILISHEKDKVNDEGNTIAITLALGGELPNETAVSVGEVWYMRDSNVAGKEIVLKPYGLRTPMKTRMFEISKEHNIFKWCYDIKKPNPVLEIATMFSNWEKSGYEKLELPK